MEKKIEAEPGIICWIAENIQVMFQCGVWSKFPFLHQHFSFSSLLIFYPASFTSDTNSEDSLSLQKTLWIITFFLFSHFFPGWNKVISHSEAIPHLRLSYNHFLKDFLFCCHIFGMESQNHLWCLRCRHTVVAALQAHRNSLKIEKSRL